MLAHLLGLIALAAPLSAPPQAPAPTSEPSGDFVVYEIVAYRDRVELDGSQTRTVEARALLRNATAVAQLGQIGWPYVDTLAEVDFEKVVIQKADGREVEVTNGLVEDVNPWGVTGTSIAADVRFKKMTIPGLEAGDRLSYRLVHRQKAMAPGRAFGELKLTPSLGDPVQTYELDLPRPSPFHVRLREGLDAAWEEVPSAPDRHVRRLRLKVPRPSAEDLKSLTKKTLEQWAEPDVIFTSFASWEDVARWWWELSRGRLAPDSTIRAQAESLVGASAAPREALERLHAFVASSVRYVNVNFGIGRMQPRPAPQVLANRYGDCKDKHALLAALAASRGLDVRPVLIHSTRPDLRDDVPAPQQFDHMVSVARLGPDPSTWLWLDGTDRFGAPGYLAASLRDKRALLVEASGEARIVRTPAEPPFVPRTEVEVKATLLGDGVLRGRSAWRFRSDQEVQLRAILEAVPEQQRPDVLKASLAQAWTDAKVTNVAVSDLASVAEPLRIEFDVERPAPKGFAAGDRDLWVPLPAFDLPEVKEPPALDSDPLEFPLREFTIRAEIEIPAGLTARAPLSVSIDRPFGRFESAYSAQGPRLTVARTLKLVGRSLDPAQAAAYAGFRKAIDSDRDQEFLILGTAAEPAASSPAALRAEGLAAHKKKDYAKAVELLRKASEGDPRIEDVFLDLGQALNEAGRFEDAVAAFTRQVETSPFHESAYAWRARVLDRLDRGEDAEKDLLKQIEVAPFESWSYNTLADRRTRQGRFREAADLYSRAVAIDPKAKGRWVDLAWAEARAGSADAARATLAHARTLDLPDWMKISAAGASLLAGDAATAADLATTGLSEMAPRLARLSADVVGEDDLWTAEYLARGWHVLGATAIEKGDLSTGERYLDAAWRLWFLPDAAWALGNLRERQGRIGEAVAFWTLADAVPAPGLNLPADRKERIGAVARKQGISEAGWDAPARLLSARTVTIHGPVVTDLTEEVLLLVRQSGEVEQIRTVVENDASMLDKQMPHLGSLRLAVTSPDGSPFKALRRGVLACSRATSCVLVIDCPGVGGLRRPSRSSAAR